MKKKQKITALALVLAVLAVMMSGCGKVVLPETTSDEAGIYLLGDKIVGKDGEVIVDGNGPVYGLDEDGNAVKHGEKKDEIIVAAANLKEFTCITKVEYDETATKQELVVYKLSDGSEMLDDLDWEMVLKVGPEDAVNTEFTVTSSDLRTICFTDGEEKIESDKAGDITLKLTGLYTGEAKLFVTNKLGEVIQTIDFDITSKVCTDEEELAEVEAAIAECEHEYKVEVVPATEMAEGYTEHTCIKCGHTFRDEYTAKLPCQHTFTEREVKATCTEKGYTLCTCSKCGYTEKKNYTELAAHSYRDEVVAPTCTEKGYTKHTCTVCGFVLKDTYTECVAHTYKAEIVKPTCTEQGYTKHTCTVCGYVMKDTYTPCIEHSFTHTVVAPTYMEKGYTEHRCTVCGYTYKDNYTAVIPCTNHKYVETSRTAPTCTAAGTIIKTCTICGKTTTESVPATGHKYKDTVVPATCCDRGYTTHYCTTCGYSYDDAFVNALGHQFHEESYDEQVGTESHNICSACGQDFHGWSSSSVTAHLEAHALAGEASGYYSKAIPIYEHRTYKVCGRCGYEERIS